VTSAMLNRHDLGPLLPRITTPTLMIVPSRDQWLPAGQIHAAVTQMPHAVALEVDGEGHVAPILAQAEELADIIGRFWRDPSGYIMRPG
ncbi:MAG: alpha/beta fold hydrolase, partial [Pseudonocardia sp.]